MGAAQATTEGYTREPDARFRRINAKVLGTEGGWSNDVVDKGGATKYGVSLRFAKALGHIDANRDGFADLDLNFDTVIDGHDIRLITPEIATGLFFRHFWISPGIHTLPRPMDAAVYDQAVNAGTTAAIKLLQRALNRCGLRPPALKVDGQMGLATRRAAVIANASGKDAFLLHAYRDEAARRYWAIVAADETQRRFINGWLARAERLGDV